MTNKKVLALLLVLAIPILSSCWDKRELTDIALVAALGIDRNEDKGYIGSLQIVNPGNVAGGLQGGSSGQMSPVTVYHTKGDNLTSISSHSTAKISRSLYYGHTNLVVISEELAREEGLLKILEPLDRNIQFRANTQIVISRDTSAHQLLEVLTPVDRVPSRKIIKTLEYAQENLGEMFTINIQDTIDQIITEGREPLIPGFEIEGSVEGAREASNIEATEPKGILKAAGLAAFKEGKLVDWFDHKEAVGVLFILDKIKQDYVNVDWEGTKSAISYRIMDSNTDVTVLIRNGKPEVDIHVKTKGNINEAVVPIDLLDQKVLSEIEQLVEEGIVRMMEDAITKAKENKIDIFGFGVGLHRSDPKSWKRMKSSWNEDFFPEITVHLKVDSNIRHTGLRNKPYLYQMEGVKKEN